MTVELLHAALVDAWGWGVVSMGLPLQSALKPTKGVISMCVTAVSSLICLQSTMHRNLEVTKTQGGDTN